MNESDSSEPAARLIDPGNGPTLELGGDWTVLNLDRLPLADLMSASASPPTAIDARRVTALDTAGAVLVGLLVERSRRSGQPCELRGLSAQASDLFAFVEPRRKAGESAADTRSPAEGVVVRLGRAAVESVRTLGAPVAMLGAIVASIVRGPVNLRRFRAMQLVWVIEHAGIGAIPLVALLAFLLGLVVAYQGGVQLAVYGAATFTLELTVLTMFRELAPLITAIIVAGRSGAAYAAELATMSVLEEIDALRTMAVDPIELLVLPRVVGLVVCMTLLVVVADLASLLGGVIAATLFFDFEPGGLLSRLPDSLGINAFAIGLAKAPMFGALVGVVSCAQGLEARGGADAVGRRTTSAVVHGIFLVVVSDAVVSIVLSYLKL